MKRFLQKIFHKNPLSYLGWLGFIGIVGLVLRTPVMIACLLCFTFFAYSDMIADELFWANVRRAGFRAFLAGFLFSILCLAILVPRAIYYQFPQPQVTDGMVQLSEQSYLQSLFCSAAFVFLFILMLAVFSISLLVFRHREKRALRETGA